MPDIQKLTGGLFLALLLAGCGDPLAGVNKLSDMELAADAPRAELVAPERETDTPVARPGLLATMLKREKDDAPVAKPDVPETPETTAQTGNETALEAPPKRGFLGIFSRNEPAEPDPIPPVTKLAALPPETPDTPDKPSAKAPKPAAQNKPLFGRAKSKQPPSVRPGTLLSFGEVKPVCNLPRTGRGKETHAFPERGKVWRLYDSAPGKTTPHPFYVTGFADGCARTFTAAVAVFGAPGMHELLRYGLPAKVQPYSATDDAYEKIKSKICRVARRKPCGTKVSKLEKNTVFVSAYENYGSNGRWFNMLLHAGEVVATDIKNGG